MSKGEDTKVCARALAPVVEKLRSAVRVQTHFIQHESGDKVMCQHGPEECAGNLAQLCVDRHAPPERNHEWAFRFMLCAWDSGLPLGSGKLVNTCLDKVGVAGAPREAMLKCIAGPEGLQLMEASARTVGEHSAWHGCVVMVDHQQRCTREGGKWLKCPGGSGARDFERSLCEAYKKKAGRDADACHRPVGAR
ncbi:MAG: hypothetical protein J3K34DRAFT_430522 [Monoraphidium minutum]|nr:MAG: hypothetical protein J3K34DRAFT_430522 [Monoraphidium minutum]